MPPKVVVHGAQLRCTMGNKPSNLVVAAGKNIQVENQEVATVEDFQPNTNICPFGMCQSPSNPQVAAAQSPQPCVPNILVRWAPGGVKVSLTGPASLTEDSKCNCLWGGVISVQKAAQTTVFIGNGVVMGGGVTIGGGGGRNSSGKSTNAAGKSGSAAGDDAVDGSGDADAAQEDVSYDEQIELIDQITGKPMTDCPYVILHNGEAIAQGRTDANGMTSRVESGSSEAEMTLLWGDDALDWS